MACEYGGRAAAVGARRQSGKGSFEGLGEYKDLPPRCHGHEDQSWGFSHALQSGGRHNWTSSRCFSSAGGGLPTACKAEVANIEKINIPGGVAVPLAFVFEAPWGDFLTLVCGVVCLLFTLWN